VALYGGSFDPPHVCHVLVATWVLCREPVDELRVIPVYRHAFGKPLAPFERRCEMLEAAMAHLGPRVRIDRVEARLGGTSYTIDTVRALLAAEPDLALSFVCGTDLFAQRARFKEWDALQTLLGQFIVIGRQGDPAPPGVDVRARLPDVSSTEVRERVASGAPFGHLVPRPVRDLIAAHHLYRP
jgi:nicotinate-nucleotide adenylyltransferase